MVVDAGPADIGDLVGEREVSLRATWASTRSASVITSGPM
jgi:hypothetical protein